MGRSAWCPSETVPFYHRRLLSQRVFSPWQNLYVIKLKSADSAYHRESSPDRLSIVSHVRADSNFHLFHLLSARSRRRTGFTIRGHFITTDLILVLNESVCRGDSSRSPLEPSVLRIRCRCADFDSAPSVSAQQRAIVAGVRHAAPSQVFFNVRSKNG